MEGVFGYAILIFFIDRLDINLSGDSSYKAIPTLQNYRLDTTALLLWRNPFSTQKAIGATLYPRKA